MLAHERLQAWKLCHELVLAVYAATSSFPKYELYGLTSQARRSAFSAAVNIVEGAAKRGPREFRRFLDISIGSLAELAYVLQLVRDLKLLVVVISPHPSSQFRKSGRTRSISRLCGLPG